MTSNNSKPILKIYFINNEYLSSCNICIYNIPKKKSKIGIYPYNFDFKKFKFKKDKYDVNVSISIPEEMIETFMKYGIMQKNQLSYCEVIQNSNTHFSLSVWIYTCEQEIVGKKIRVREDRMNLTASINKHKKKQKSQLANLFLLNLLHIVPLRQILFHFLMYQDIRLRAVSTHFVRSKAGRGHRDSEVSLNVGIVGISGNILIFVNITKLFQCITIQI